MNRHVDKSINFVLIKLIFVRLLLPIIILNIGVIMLSANKNFDLIEFNQKQNAEQIVQNIDLYLEQSAKMLDSVVIASQDSNDKESFVFMKSTWEAYGYFDTIYKLDKDSKIDEIVPFDSKYLGVDLSNFDNFEDTIIYNFKISKPFISLRTGEPTIYLMKKMNNSKYIVGELNLEKLQDEVVKKLNENLQDEIFILDKSGTLIAHPNDNLVRQQVNQSDIEILSNKENINHSLIYDYDGHKVMGRLYISEISGWQVITQTNINIILKPYIMGLIYTTLIFLIFWLFLIISIKESLNNNVIEPLKILSEGVSILAQGDFNGISHINSMEKTFEELEFLIRDVSYMGNELLISNQELEEKVNDRTMELNAMNEELMAINEELNDTLYELKLTQEHLIESERIAALGSLVAGISHEVNTPVGVSLTAASYLSEITEKIFKSMQSSKLTKKELVEYMDTVKETTEILNVNLERAAKLIQSFKNIAVDSSTDEVKEIYIKEYINTIILSLKHEFKDKNITFEVICEDDLKMVTYTGEFSQIITNLIMNSLIHGFKNRHRGSIMISVSNYKDFIKINFKDDGIGISKDILSEIFNPFFTTNRAGGSTGLGLSIVYNILKGKLEGDIENTKDISEGVEFVVKIKNMI